MDHKNFCPCSAALMASTCAEANPRPLRLPRHAPRCAERRRRSGRRPHTVVDAEIRDRWRLAHLLRRRSGARAPRVSRRSQETMRVRRQQRGAAGDSDAAASSDADALAHSSRGVAGRRQRGRFAGVSAAQVREHLFQRRQPLRVDHFQQSQFQMQSRIGLAPQVVVGRSAVLEKARQVLFAEISRPARRAAAARSSAARQPARNPRRTRAPPADCENAESPRGRSAAGFGLRRSGGEPAPARARPIGSRIASTSSSSTLSATTPSSSRTCWSVIVVAAIGDRLLQQRKPVAQASFRGARQHRHGARFDLSDFPLSRFVRSRPRSL